MIFKCFVALFFLFGGLQGQRDERNQTGMPRMAKFLATPLEKWFNSCGSRQPSSINFISSAFRDCIQRQGFPYDSINLDSRMDVAYRSRTVADTDETCHMIKALADCSQEITNNLGSCLSPDAMKEVKTVFGSFHHSVCGGKMLLKKMFGSSSALECYANYAESTFKCMSSKPELMEEWFSKVTSTSKTIYTPEYCRVQRELKKCTVDLRVRCPDTATPEFFEAAVNSMNGDSARCSSSAAELKFNILNIFMFALVSLLLRKFSSN